ncbi:MAG: prohibitin family protein [Vampirovibrionales bacterium]|nr:prohibitin family protein [Vampirovibrionales bacterium]
MTFSRLPVFSSKMPVAAKVWTLLGLSLVGIFLFQQCFTIIPPGYRGISVTLGSVDRHFRREGFSLKMPFIEEIVRVPIKQITVSGKAACFSSDLQTVQVDFQALYRIPENKVVELFQKYQGDPYQSLLEPRIQESLKEESANYRAEDLVKNREAVKRNVMEKVSHKVDGLLVVQDIPIANIDLSDDLEHAIEQKQIKEQEALAKRYELDKAKKDAEITLVNAEAEAKAVQIKGQALKSSPQVIELDIVKKWNGVSPTTVVVGKGGGNIMLPLR